MLQPPSSNPTRDYLWGSSQLTVKATGEPQDFFHNQALSKSEVCLGSLSCWKVQCCSSFSFLTDNMTFSPRISRYSNESILPSTHCRFLLVPEDAKQAQSITEPPPCCSAIFSICSSSSRHTADPQGQKCPVLFLRSTEQNPKTSVAYLYDFKHIGANFSCALGSVVVHVLEF